MTSPAEGLIPTPPPLPPLTSALEQPQLFNQPSILKPPSSLPTSLPSIAGIVPARKIDHSRVVDLTHTLGKSEITRIRDLRPLFTKAHDLDTKYTKPSDVVQASSEAERDKKVSAYGHAMEHLEMSISDASQEYIAEDIHAVDSMSEGQLKTFKEQPAGPLLKFSRTLSKRYMDLYRAYVHWQMKRNIPMLSNAAGQLKGIGFETEEIIELKTPSQTILTSINKFRNYLLSDMNHQFSTDGKTLNQEGTAKLDAFMKILFSKGSRDAFQYDQATASDEEKLLHDAITTFQSLDSAYMKQLDRMYFMLTNFAHCSPSDSISKLEDVANLTTYPSAGFDERLLMELRHRVGGDGSDHQTSPGALGQNPLGYLSVIKEATKFGDSVGSTHPEAEFRAEMYLAYMSNHFANTVMLNEDFIETANEFLEKDQSGWKLDMKFITAMNSRGDGSLDYLPPIFRYGAYAGINGELRKPVHDYREKAKAFSHLIPTVGDLKSGASLENLNKNFRYRFSSRETRNLFGDENPLSDTKVPMGSGAFGFDLFEPESIPQRNAEMAIAAKSYTEAVRDAHIPVQAGISGTYDQSMAMAMLVGLGTDKPVIQETRAQELEDIKLAYLAFMLPNRDHSVHEIMTSSKTYGLAYTPGPGYEEQVYRNDPKFVDKVRLHQAKRVEVDGITPLKMPIEYLRPSEKKEVVTE